MPRRRPGELRHSRTPKAGWHTVPHVPGIDRSTQYTIAQLELRTAANWAAHGLWPGMTVEALSAWAQTAQRPSMVTFLPCDCCGRHPRALLQETLEGLPSPAAAALYRRIEPLDAQYLANTLSDPHLPNDLPWWQRRLPR